MKTRNVFLIVAVWMAGAVAFAQVDSRNPESRTRSVRQSESQPREVAKPEVVNKSRVSDRDVSREVGKNVRNEQSPTTTRESVNRSNENNRVSEGRQTSSDYREKDNRGKDFDNRNEHSDYRGSNQPGSVNNRSLEQDRNSDNRNYNDNRNSNNRDYRNDRNFDSRGNYNNHSVRDNRYLDYHGNGFTIGRRVHRFDACPFCYGPRLNIGFSRNYSLQELARIETERLQMALNLTNRQVSQIYSINLNYLYRRSGSYFMDMERRERSIRSVLRWSQIQAYDRYITEIGEGDICDHCYSGRGNRSFGLAFRINF